MIKDIIVNLSVTTPGDPAVGYAASVAQAFEAQICGVAFAYDPIVPASAMDGASTSVIAAEQERGATDARAAIARFEAVAQTAAAASRSHLLQASLGGAASLFAQLARRFDLVVVAQPEAGAASPEDLVIETTLLESGRPVIVVPYIQKEPMSLKRVLVCWDGRRTAARAIADALPFLRRAQTVEMVTVDDGRALAGGDAGLDMAIHLRRHGLTLSEKTITPGSVDVANTLLSHAAESGADLVVMGGYGRSRLREFLLGGATSGILRAMTVPTLMSH